MIKRIVFGTAIAAAGCVAYAATRRSWMTWGVDPAEAARPLFGDDLVPDPTSVDTRGITIEAPPEAVWPWLVQMGFGRAGWYSYDRLDMRGASADRIVPEWQRLEVGGILPTHPDGGLEVRAVEPGRAFVAYVDSATVERWKQHRSVSVRTTSPGLAMSGGFLETATGPEFAASWAVVIEPAEEGRTRLIERFRIRLGEASVGSRALGPLLGFGVFVMTRRHMIGVRRRAETLAGAGLATNPEPRPAGAEESSEVFQPA